MTGLGIIKKFEGLKLEAYLCPAGIPTIGVGHTRGVKLGQKISVEQAEAFLSEDYKIAEDAVKRLVKVPLNGNQLGALTSFVFNLGEGRLMGSTLLRLLNQGEYRLAALEFDKWVYSGGKKLNGLIARRKAERELFESK